MSLNGNHAVDVRGRAKVRPVVDIQILDPKLERLTVQGERDMADINKIIQRMEKTGTILGPTREPFYGDVSGFTGLADALEMVQNARELFMQIPASIREKFDNDPVKMVAFLEDPGNLDAAVEMGLVEKRPDVVPAEPVPSPAVPAVSGEPK